MSGRGRHRARRQSPRPRPVLGWIEGLEPRALLSSATATVHTNYELLAPAAVNSTVEGFTPSQVRKAYGFDEITFAHSTVPADGRGQTIAIVDAYNHPNVAADLEVFNTEFGLPSANLKLVNQRGGNNLPRTDAGWAGEIALDVQWAHAMAPGANLLLVEADSDSTEDLMTAVDYARRAAGVSVISLSWGGSEFVSWGREESNIQLTYDRTFTTPPNHTGVTFVAASGDSGTSGGVLWPATSPNVVSVGGTSLETDAGGTYLSEDAWRGFRNGTSGGFSKVEPEPDYQQVAQQSGDRSTPDVGYNGDPATGVAVYDSLPYQGDSGWDVVGGTSAGAPQWAAIIAIANQGRALSGLSSLDSRTQTLPTLYSLYSPPGTAGYEAYTAAFNDIGADGYGYTTGLGTPKVPAVVSALIGTTPGSDPGGGDDPGGTPDPTRLPASPLAATFSSVPVAGVEGEEGTLKLRLTNASGARFTGPVSVSVYASSDDAVSTDDTIVTAVTLPRVTLRAEASKSVKLKFTRPTGLAEGSYALVASITATDTNTAPAQAVTPTRVTIEKPRVDLSTTFADDRPIRVNPGRGVTVPVSVHNLGNVTASGTLGLTLYASVDPTLDGSDRVLATLPGRSFRVRPGHVGTWRVHFRAPEGVAGGAYYLIASATATTQPADADASNDVVVAPTA